MRFLLFLFTVSICAKRVSAQPTARDIRQSAQRFVDSLSPAQRQKAVFGFADTARQQWTNLPVGVQPRKGINLGSLSAVQRQLFHRLLAASFSGQGYLKITGVMYLDDLTNSLFDSLHTEGKMNDTVYQMFRDFRYSHGNYHIALFGSPLRDTDWGFKVEGHHLSINLTCKGDRLFYSPFFIGALPSEVKFTEYAGWRVLGREQDLSLRLFASLSALQRKAALLPGEMPGDVFTHWESGKNTLPYKGIQSRRLTSAQQKLLADIVHEYCYNLPSAEAALFFSKAANNGKGNLYFAWMGSGNEDEPHYFIINGPSFLLEFANVGNHIHSIWRQKGFEFGASVLRE